jgi:hypothetical protein
MGEDEGEYEHEFEYECRYEYEREVVAGARNFRRGAGVGRGIRYAARP